jgi:hypothetical protein
LVKTHESSRNEVASISAMVWEVLRLVGVKFYPNARTRTHYYYHILLLMHVLLPTYLRTNIATQWEHTRTRERAQARTHAHGVSVKGACGADFFSHAMRERDCRKKNEVNEVLAKKAKDSTFGCHLGFLAEPFFFFPFFSGMVFTSWSEQHDR